MLIATGAGRSFSRRSYALRKVPSARVYDVTTFVYTLATPMFCRNAVAMLAYFTPKRDRLLLPNAVSLPPFTPMSSIPSEAVRRRYMPSSLFFLLSSSQGRALHFRYA